MKKILALVLALAMTLSLAGCGAVGKAEATVKNFFEACKAGNLEDAQKYLVIEEEAETEDNAEVYDMAALVLEKLDYSLVSSEQIDENTVTVTASVTAPDMKVAVGEFFQQALAFAFSNAFSEAPLSDEEAQAEMMNMFIEAMSKEDLGLVTNEAAISVVKTEEGWKIDADEDFADAVTGGMLSALEELSSSFTEE
ncbi:MAG: DUF4878 domain-containing protein [Clostridia bacterium]|nr:DUF4878 domain-containing protein [Clostridia bacterium]